jgi:hypothetical protein
MQNVGAVEYNIGYNERKWLTMANLYTIQDLLIGKTYNSKTLRGEIISADKSNVWYENAESYLVQIKSDTGKYTYRNIAVKVGE